MAFRKHVLSFVVLILAAAASPTAQAQTYTVLHVFSSGTDGQFPQTGVLRDAAGNLFGATVGGGSFTTCLDGCGTVYRLDTNNKETILHNFNHLNGQWPYSDLILDSSGNLYGTASQGDLDYGNVFMLGKNAKETVLYQFAGKRDGSEPQAGLVRDAAGDFYGTTAYGGVSGYGTVFKLDMNRKEAVLYSFRNGADGGYPFAGVILDGAGNLYGTTLQGGDSTCVFVGIGCGVVFKVDPAGTETVLYTFTGAEDGDAPVAGLLRDTAGNLYGTTKFGGDLTCGGGLGCGVVFKIDSAGNETVLHAFTGGSDGSFPYAGLIQDAGGNLYGTAADGGDATCNLGIGGCGTVFKIGTSGTETVLYAFPGGANGASPRAHLTRDAEGSLYGTTVSGGDLTCYVDGCGVVFKLTP